MTEVETRADAQAFAKIGKYVWIQMGGNIGLSVLLQILQHFMSFKIVNGSTNISCILVSCILSAYVFAKDHKRSATKAEAHRFALWSAGWNIGIALLFFGGLILSGLLREVYPEMETNTLVIALGITVVVFGPILYFAFRRIFLWFSGKLAKRDERDLASK